MKVAIGFDFGPKQDWEGAATGILQLASRAPATLRVQPSGETSAYRVETLGRVVQLVKEVSAEE